MGIMPKGLVDRPEMGELGASWYGAFNVLSSSRQYGMNGPMAVLISEMLSYAKDVLDLDLDDRGDFITVMQRLDSTYLAEVAKRSATATKSEVVNDGAATDNPAKG